MVNRTTATAVMPARSSASSRCAFVISSGGALSGRTTRERMRVEGHRHRRAAMFGGAAPDALDDLEVAAVKAVEVAERQHGMHEPRRPRVVRKVEDLHAATTRRPRRRARGHHMPAQRPRAGARWSRVRQIVRHVREVRAARRDPLDHRERFVDGEVRRVRLVAQRVEDERLDTLDQRPRLVRDAIAIGQVREVAEAEAEDRQLPVPQRHGHDVDAAERERPGDLVRGRAAERRRRAAATRRRRK